MILGDEGIKNAFLKKQIKISPFRKNQIQPASYDVTLSNIYLVLKRTGKAYDITDEKCQQEFESVNCTHSIILNPFMCILASTREIITLSKKYCAELSGCSSLGRNFISVHCTAGFIDPGFCGSITLEISNIGKNPVVLYPNMKIGQLKFFEVSGCATKYNNTSVYSGQREPIPPKVISIHK